MVPYKLDMVRIADMTELYLRAHNPRSLIALK